MRAEATNPWRLLTLATLAQLGWDPAPARRALAVALAWLHEGPYLSHGVAEKLRLAPEALAARESFHREAPA